VAENDRPTDELAGNSNTAAENDSDGADNDVPGPSPNPATNLLILDLILRGVARVSRIAAERALLGRRYDPEFSKRAISNRSRLQTLAAYGATRVATRSVPGFALVATGLIARTLFDRSQSMRKARRKGDEALRERAYPEDQA
jgi:hypothetical protein